MKTKLSVDSFYFACILILSENLLNKSKNGTALHQKKMKKSHIGA